VAQEKIFEIVKGEKDIVDCDQIPIRFPGEIQSFAFVVAFEVATERIVFHSNNVRSWFSDTRLSSGATNLESLFGQKLYDFLVKKVKPSPEGARAYPVPAHLISGVEGEVIWVTRSRVGKNGYFEFERVWQSDERDVDVQTMACHFASIEYLSNDFFFQALTDVCGKICPSERILLYRFDEEWNGEVLAETCEESRKRFLNHWFPASDIPRQVRDQYLINPIRMISDVSSAAIGLTMLDETPPENVDLSRFVSRGVARVHQEYLLNMDVHSSFSVAVISGGKLWGLLAMHHSCPRVVTPVARAMLHSLALLTGCRIGEMEANERTALMLSRQEALLKMQNTPQKTFDLQLAKQIIPCDGLLHLHGDQRVDNIGEATTESELKSIRSIIDAHAKSDKGVVVFDDLNHERNGHDLTFAGALGVYVKKESDWEYLVWLRKPRVEKRQWGGKPTKPSDLLPGRGRIQPRKSFETWVENYSRSPLKFSSTDVQFANQCLKALD